MNRRATLAIIAAITVAGCGSASLSTTQLRSQASRICQAAGRQTDRIPAPGSPAGATAFLRSGVAVLRPELAALRTLEPPSGLRRVYAIALGAFAQKLAALGDAIHALGSGGDPRIEIKTLEQRLAPIEEQENGAWRTLQIPACQNR